MTPVLRDYQENGVLETEQAWAAGHRNVMLVMPTGAGKTVTLGNIMAKEPGAQIAIAHRKELVGQLSLALATYSIPHRIIGPSHVVRFAVQQHMENLGRSFYRANAPTAVAGVDTLLNRGEDLASWLPQVTRWVIDECHHLIKDNKWGRAVDMFPNARGLGVTATPLRADGKGLGRHASGVFDHMVVGPTMRNLINREYLSDYRIFAPQSDFNTENLKKGRDGDYTKTSLKNEAKRSHIMGDVVEHYKRLASGKRGVTFVTDVETGSELAARFNDSGVPAEMVSAKTSDHIRASAIRRLKNGEILQLINVDLFGEGFDLPAIEVVSFARPTASYALFAQQFGRALRILEGKLHAIIIDHVGNVFRHGLPDRDRDWSMDDREKRRKKEVDPDMVQVRECPNCSAVYEKLILQCPYCGHEPIPAIRSKPEHVDGDLVELDPDTLAEMRGEIARIDGPARSGGLDGVAKAGCEARHRERQQAQGDLRQAIAIWAGHHRANGYEDRQIYRMFFWRFSTDVMTAQTLGKSDALELRTKVVDDLPC